MKEIFVYYDLELAIWRSLDCGQNRRIIEHEMPENDYSTKRNGPMDLWAKHQKMLQATPNFRSICIMRRSRVTMPHVIPEM